MIPLIYSTNSVRLRFKSTLAAVIGIALSVFVLSLVLMLRQGINNTVVGVSEPDTAIVLRTGAHTEMFSFINDRQIARLTALPSAKIEALMPEFVIIKMFGMANGPGAGTALVRGVPDGIFSFSRGFRLVAGRLPIPGRNEVIVGRLASMRFAHLGLGDHVEMAPSQTAEVVGVFALENSSFESEVWGSLDLIRGFFGRQGVTSSIRLRMQPSDILKFASDVRNSDLTLVVKTEAEYYRTLSEKPKAFISSFGMLLGLFSVIASIIAISTVLESSIDRRRNEILLLRRMGFGVMAVLGAILRETALLGLIGGAVGVLAAQFLAHYKITIMSISTWSNLVVGFDVTTNIILISLGAGVAIAILGSMVPTFKTARLYYARAS